jgi:benzoyl-CoA-dihydrodiol lyase
MNQTARSISDKPANAAVTIDFQTHPDQYKHWKLTIRPPLAELKMDVAEDGAMFEGYQLKLNSYDIGVDIELYDAIQRLRLEHPEVKTVVISSARLNMFCAGANIRMLGGAAHGHKVNFCKFTNETRNSIEDASEYSGQHYLCAINGTAAGGGYELAVSCDYLILIDDNNAAVSLPEVPLLAVLPGTGGLTRVVDKRKVRRDLADIFCTVEEGIRGQRAVDWHLVDEVVKGSSFKQRVHEKAMEMAANSNRPDGQGITLTPLPRKIGNDELNYAHLKVSIDRVGRTATFMIKGPETTAPETTDAAVNLGCSWYLLDLVRQLDDAILHMRFNEPAIGTLIFKSTGDREKLLAHDAFMHAHADNWFVREVQLYWKRTLKRIDLTSRTLFTFLEPGSCFAGVLAELIFAADRAYMLEGGFEGDDTPPAAIVLTDTNFGPLPMSNGLTRLETRFLGEPDNVSEAKAAIGRAKEATEAEAMGLVTAAMDDIDWHDEIRITLEERASFSPDALTGMEANLRFAGPETMETKIFARLTAWQNWIFQRPNAVGEQGALKLYGTGNKPDYDKTRV